MKASSASKNPRARGGRPSKADAAHLRERILDVAAELFFTQGYGAVSIEAVARQARVSKRTLYHRFRDKADLFGAVLHHIIDRLRPADTAQLFEGGSLEEILQRLAKVILQAALSPRAVALQRLVLAEAARFPELAAAVNEAGARQEAIRRIAGLLEQETKAGRLRLNSGDAAFAAEQFLQMVVSAPQRRALGLGTPMTRAQLDDWARDSVRLFLNGCKGIGRP